LGPNFATPQQTQRRNNRHLVSILGLTIETLRALVLGLAGFVQKLTRYETPTG
jgi:hypothetical protein